MSSQLSQNKTFAEQAQRCAGLAEGEIHERAFYLQLAKMIMYAVLFVGQMVWDATDRQIYPGGWE